MKAIAIAAAGMAVLAGSSASAESLAAPGDCAQPIRDLDTGPLGALPAAGSGGVAGPPVVHFPPVADALSLLPLDLTRVTTPAVSLTGDAPETTSGGDGVLGNELLDRLPVEQPDVWNDPGGPDIGLPGGPGSPDPGIDLSKTVTDLVGRP
jgi:hypothetical protein